MRYLAPVLLSCALGVAVHDTHAQQANPAPTADGSGALPEITIVRRQGGSIDEYRLNDRVFMVKVMPGKGNAYYMVDTDGDGKLNTRYNAMDDGLVIPSWVLQ